MEHLSPLLAFRDCDIGIRKTLIEATNRARIASRGQAQSSIPPSSEPGTIESGALRMNTQAAVTKSPVLTCWKDIANYMGKGVRTVQRWEQELGLPVRRPLGSSKKAVLARPADLDAWVALRCGSRAPLRAVSNDKRQDPVIRLAALSAQIQTSRQLRDYNCLLIDEFRSAMVSLQQQILTLQNLSVSCGRG